MGKTMEGIMTLETVVLLKTCPFCGGPASYKKSEIKGYAGEYEHILGCFNRNCLIKPNVSVNSVVFPMSENDLKKKLIEIWNRRI